ncbi:MAG: 2-oxoacid:acceptor oxidoreductase family protein [candidate division Zixibacteria bacterium]|nr:2-oxoacid:acceptor oxidoreductase family protein [candidate division Zixibacteria bacterium]
MEGRFEMRLSGSGGQGLVLAGVMIAEAVGVYEGKNVAQTQSYGPEARGGTSRSDLVISDDEIYYPKTSELDLLLALTQEAADKYYTHLNDKGIIVVDSDIVRQLPPFPRVYSMPFTRTAREEIGTEIVANVISAAALVVVSGICKPESFLNAVLNRAPKGTESKNEKACKLGFDMGKNALKGKVK